MNKLKKREIRTISIICILALMSILAVGCSGNNGKPNENASATPSGMNSAQSTGDANFNATGLPVVNDKVTLKVSGPKHNAMGEFSDMDLIQELEKMTNVHVEWETVPNPTWQERKNLIFASGELPDGIINIEDNDIVKYGSEGMLIPVEGLIDEYMPNLKRILDARPLYRSSLTAPDGHIYSFPRILEEDHAALQDTLWINSAWLNKLQLSVPTTTEEFREVLSAFKNRDPNGNNKKDEIPLSFVFKTPDAGIYSMFGAFGRPDNVNHVVVEDGKVVFTADKNEYKEAVKYFHSLYKDGLIDPESFSQTVDVYHSLGQSKDYVLGSFVNYNASGVTGPERQDDYKYIFPPLKGPDGDQIWGAKEPAYFIKGAFAITSANPYPEVTARWLDQVYEPDMSIQFAFGPYGLTQKLHSDGKVERIPAPADMSAYQWRSAEAPNNFFVYVMLNEDRLRTIFTEQELLREKLFEDAKPYMEKAYFPSMLMAPEEVERLSALKTDIYELINKKTAEWIARGNIDEEWDAYVAQMNKMGLNDLIQIYSQAYERFSAGK